MSRQLGKYFRIAVWIFLCGTLVFVARGKQDRKSTRLNSSHSSISYAVFCLKKKKNNHSHHPPGRAHFNTETTFSSLYRKTNGGTVQHVRITLPVSYLGISAQYIPIPSYK